MYRRADAASLPSLHHDQGAARNRNYPALRKACRKKNQFDLLLADLGLQRGNPPARRLKFAPADPSRELGPLLEVEARPSDLCGRPEPRRASGPPEMKRSRQMYKSLLENCSSRANALTFSPASVRLTIPSLNARLRQRCDDLGLDIRSPLENCPLFPVSQFRGCTSLLPQKNPC